MELIPSYDWAVIMQSRDIFFKNSLHFHICLFVSWSLHRLSGMPKRTKFYVTFKLVVKALMDNILEKVRGKPDGISMTLELVRGILEELDCSSHTEGCNVYYTIGIQLLPTASIQFTETNFSCNNSILFYSVTYLIHDL